MMLICWAEIYVCVYIYMYPKEKHKTLLHASMEFGLELNPKERLYVDTT